MEIRFCLDDKMAEELLKETGAATASELCRESLYLLKWEIGETKKGRQIQSYDQKDGSVRIPAMSIFNF